MQFYNFCWLHDHPARSAFKPQQTMTDHSSIIVKPKSKSESKSQLNFSGDYRILGSSPVQPISMSLKCQVLYFPNLTSRTLFVNKYIFSTFSWNLFSLIIAQTGRGGGCLLSNEILTAEETFNCQSFLYFPCGQVNWFHSNCTLCIIIFHLSRKIYLLVSGVNDSKH